MELLESAMAFAVVMILLSTIVTGIVELLLRVVGLREKTLRTTVESLFENVVWPRLEARLVEADAVTAGGGDTGATNGGAADNGGAVEETAEAKSARVKKDAREKFVSGMTANPAFVAPTDETQVEEADERQGGAAGEKPKKTSFFAGLFAVWPFSWLRRLSELNLSHKETIDVLTPLAFAERLARTDVGKAIVAEGKQELEPLVQDFVRTFDRYGRAASEVFRKNAKAVAMVVGILFALIANVDAGRLFTSLMENPKLRQSLIEQAGEAGKANEEAVERLQEVAERIEAGNLEGNQAKQIEEAAGKIEAGIEALQGKGLPIGYAFYPYCSEGAAGDLSCADEEGFWSGLFEFLRWLVFTIVAGILIGLGGPFWFRVFSSLSQIFQVLRSFGVGSKPKQAKPEELDAAPAAEESAKPKDVIDAFTVAAHVHSKATVPAKRALLGPDGQTL